MASLRKGMSEDEVLDAMGEPPNRTTPVMVSGSRRQEWLYGPPDGVIVYFVNGRLESASSTKGIILRR